jgi:hypothetical protein
MSGRTAALVGTLIFALALAALTVDVMVREGIDVLVVTSLIVLAMIGFGVIGALLHPPDE